MCGWNVQTGIVQSGVVVGAVAQSGYEECRIGGYWAADGVPGNRGPIPRAAVQASTAVIFRYARQSTQEQKQSKARKERISLTAGLA